MRSLRIFTNTTTPLKIGELTVLDQHAVDFRKPSRAFAEALAAAEPQAGGFCAWEWGACSATCGGGTRRATRVCECPPPANGGVCEGEAVLESSACNEDPCPVPVRRSDVDKPVAGAWCPVPAEAWGPCSAECGPDGRRVATRRCACPAPAFGGADCDGDVELIEQCGEPECPAFVPPDLAPPEGVSCAVVERGSPMDEVGRWWAVCMCMLDSVC